MSFLDNPNNAGTAVTVIGIVQIILGIVLIALGFIDDETDILVGAVGGIGNILVGFLYFGFGKSIRGGEISDKWDIACRFVLLTAIVSFVNGIFGYDGELSHWISSVVIGIIVAAVIYWVYTRMTAGGDNVINKILWILIVVVLVISLLVNIGELLAFPVGTVLGICGIIIDLFLLVTFFDADVKARMGM